jgi:hypothetical protein
MKSKAKPVKGSARTKRFDVGGTVGALAGLGTLAYLMSRKKKGADGAESGGMSKDPNVSSVADRLKDKGENNDSKVVKPPSGVIFEEDRARDRALRQSKGQGDLVPEGADRDTLYESDKALVRTDKKAPPAKTTNVNKKKPRQGSSTATTSTSVPKAGANKDVTTSLKDRNAVTLEKGTGTGGKDKGFGKTTQLSSDSGAAKTMRESRAQRLGTSYNAQYKALQSAPEGPGKEALKKSVAKAKADYEAATSGMRRGGAVKKYAAGGSVKASSMGTVKQAKPSMGSASKRADGIAQRGKTRGKVC